MYVSLDEKFLNQNFENFKRTKVTDWVNDVPKHFVQNVLGVPTALGLNKEPVQETHYANEPVLKNPLSNYSANATSLLPITVATSLIFPPTNSSNNSIRQGVLTQALKMAFPYLATVGRAENNNKPMDYIDKTSCLLLLALKGGFQQKYGPINPVDFLDKNIPDVRGPLTQAYINCTTKANF